MTQSSASHAALLQELGLGSHPHARVNLSTAALYEEAVRRQEGLLSDHGAFVVNTGKHTGRSAKDKFVVRSPETESVVEWGEVNQPMTEAHFAGLRTRVLAHLQARDIFVQECSVGADEAHRVAARVVSERAWHNLFAKNMFLGPWHGPKERMFTVLHAPSFFADPATDGTRTSTCIALNFKERMVIVCGTEYAGEVKKSMFTVMNFLMPAAKVMPMHSSINVGKGGDVAVFFGLSGTGKTTLSADPERLLVGDDEHGWSDTGVFNFEGGCYAKAIKLSAAAEPEIYATTQRFGTVLENVLIDENTRVIDLDSEKYTENTRASYTVEQIPNIVPSGKAGTPKNIIFLTCDAFGVLPPISKLTPAQAMYHFLSGYTAKVGGTEIGVTEPKATFSTCFGAPFMPRHPGVYAALLGECIAKSGARAWLVNTGWTGGPYGTGKRIKIAHTRAMVAAALDGKLDEAKTVTDPVFAVQAVTAVPGVPTEAMHPRDTWADKAAYDAQAKKLAQMFHDNFTKYAAKVSPEIAAAGPKLG